jgi:branched-chain amino acid transport system ATP-binding protein
VLSVKAIETFYGAIRAVKGISLEIPEGHIVTLLGANGAGKSTTLKTLSGLLKPATGTIEFDGRRIEGLHPEKIVRLGISQVPEGREIFSDMTTRENLEMGAYSRKDGSLIKKDMDRVFEYFPILRTRQSQTAGTLSGGEQQMLAIGRGLMSRPKLLLLDEPSLGLAPVLVEEIFSIIEQINGEGTTILLVEQNANMALQISHYGYVLETGTISLADKTENLLSNEEVTKSYLGK